LGGAAVLVASTLAAIPAAADAGPKMPEGWYLPVGIDLGGAFRGGADNGFVIGAEASLVYSWIREHGWWLGPVADIAYDSGIEGMRHRVGGEVGYTLFGVELDYVGELRPDGVGYLPGFGARGVVSIAVLSLYGGYGHLFDDVPGRDWGEFGALLKFPIEVATKPIPRPYLERPEAPAPSDRPHTPDAQPDAPPTAEPDYATPPPTEAPSTPPATAPDASPPP
jgi:hypothetical protein